jgi:protein-tyrosine phosphatase
MVAVMKVLFVCAANIVRSFMAETVLRKKLAKKGIADVVVSSAALIDMKGASADPHAVRTLEENGIEADGHVSRFLTDEMVADADLIAVMERGQKDQLGERYPEAAEKIRLLKSFMKGYQEFDSDIKDPYRLSTYHYRLCFTEIATAVDGLLDTLQAERGRR